MLRDRLTVVLLTYNCAHRIDTVLDHLLALDLPLIAVDNASTDGTAEVLAARAGVEVIRLPRNIGAAARNTAIAAARTPYVVCCDDDGWYEHAGLEHAVALLDTHARLAVVNARIVVEPEQRLDGISRVMAGSPLPDRHDLPGRVLLSFRAGAAVIRVEAFQAVGGYDPRWFIGGEEESLAMRLAMAGWQLRYVDEVVMHHAPSVANAPFLRAFGLRNTLWNAWLHRRPLGALRRSWLVLADHPKTRDWHRGLTMALAGLPWVLRERRPMNAALDADYAALDRQQFADRRAFLTFDDPLLRRARPPRHCLPVPSRT
ncbi:MAG: glycosyltransferase family 2 protein [Jatrophihabitans sp.]|uniref:glycosyltransferase family 2 protein n=1 Tax=Jatrophihabitans sp. TaxID=1932789 RepID=UPI003F7EFE2D